jgi:hypothetical protein
VIGCPVRWSIINTYQLRSISYIRFPEVTE